jgi:mono/diheme cytochrome c family protein
MIRTPTLALLALVSGCLNLPVLRDAPEIAERYNTRHKGECSSWLTSHTTGFRYCASPSFEVPFRGGFGHEAAPTGREQITDGPTDLASLQETGGAVYQEVCVVCHQADGNGLPGAFPPLAGAGEFYGTPQNQAGIIINGLSGEIVVKGQTFNGNMQAWGDVLSDYEIAAVATYVRSAWGNEDGIVLPEDVAAVR